MSEMKSRIQKCAVVFLWAGVWIYGGLCMYLFYMQSLQPPDEKYFQSDLPYHILMSLNSEWSYSITARLYRTLYGLWGQGTLLIAAFLAAVSVLVILMTERLLRVLLGRGSDALTLGAALALNLVMPFFWRYAGEYRYVSYQAGNIWHNSTYQCMKPMALAVLLYYLKVEAHYRERLSLSQWLTLSGLLALCTGIKPSFLTVFAPVLAVKLLVDLCGRVPFWKVFLLGSTVLPACGVLLWQKAVMFGADTGESFAVVPWFAFSVYASKAKVAVICSAAFPLAVLLFSAKDLLRDRRYRFAWGMEGVGFLEALLLVETGSRSRDGNFLWGYFSALFLIYVFTLEKWLGFLKREERRVLYRIAFAVCGGVLAYQLYCGVYFFVHLLQGETYFMVG